MGLDRLPTGDFHCEYNTYVFSPAAYTSAFNVRPNPDPAQRTVMTATYVMTVVDYITADDDIPADGDPGMDPVVAAVVALLTRNGAVLKYRGRGFGNHVINAGGGRYDVKWGPWTKDIGLECNGGRTVKITWTVEWTTVNCPDGLTKAGTILQFTYAVGYEIDKEGYTTRSYDATLTIAQTRKGVADKTLQASADEHREKMLPALHPGFRRESQSHRLSLDKCTLTVSVRDTQMPANMPPDGVVDGSIEHTWQSTVNQWVWAGTISASYDIARKEGKATDAIGHFSRLVEERLAEATRMVCDSPGGVAAALAASGRIGGGAPPGGLKAGHGIFGFAKYVGDAWARGRAPAAAPPAPPPAPGRMPVYVYLRGGGAAETNVLGRLQVRLNFQYGAVGCSFGEILRSGGLWRPFDAAAGVKGWKEWAASIPTVMGPRGHALLRFDPKEDSLVDACVPGAVPKVPGAQTVRPLDGQGGAPLQTLFGGLLKPPTRENSWIDYRTAVTVHADLGRAAGRTLPTAPLARGQGNEWGASAGQTAGSEGASFVHQRGKPMMYVTLTGTALRGGWEIPLPELTAVNDAKPVLVGRPMFRTEVAGYAQVPIMRAEWSLTYMAEV